MGGLYVCDRRAHLKERELVLLLVEILIILNGE